MKMNSLTSQIRLVYKRSSRLTKIAVCAAVVLSILTLLVLHSATLNAQAEAEALREQARQEQQQKNELEQNIDILGSVESAEQIAQEELGMVNPNTVIMKPEN